MNGYKILQDFARRCIILQHNFLKSTLWTSFSLLEKVLPVTKYAVMICYNFLVVGGGCWELRQM